MRALYRGHIRDEARSRCPRLVAIQGSILVATILALVGAFRQRPLLCSAAFLMIVVVSVPLIFGGIGIVTLACGSMFLPSCYWTRGHAT